MSSSLKNTQRGISLEVQAFFAQVQRRFAPDESAPSCVSCTTRAARA
jgi:hypothetical protein